jgi:hypothetical protein
VELPLQFTKLPLSLLSHAGENGRASGYRALYSGVAYRRVSLNTYARKTIELEPPYVGCYIRWELESRAGIAPACAVLQTAA